MKSRIFYLDIIRILACVMIVAMHAPIPNTGLSSFILSADSLLTAPGIGLFVMVSGALLLPINMTTSMFLKKRIGKIVFPTLFWTLFYLLVSGYDYGFEGINILRVLLSIPFSHQYGILWFMYMLAGLYLLAPILSPWLKQTGKRELEFYLILWAITMCYSYIRDFIGVNEGHTGILYYFGGYVGYFLLGYYLRTYVKAWAIGKSIILLLIPLSIATILKILQVPVHFYDSFWYLSILVAMMSVAWFLLIKRMWGDMMYNNISQLHHVITLVSNCCFGIYLVHIFIMRSIFWNWTWLYNLGIIQILSITLLTFIASLGVTCLISYLPGAEYIIGFRQKR